MISDNQLTLLAEFERRRPTTALVRRPRPEADMKTATLLENRPTFHSRRTCEKSM